MANGDKSVPRQEWARIVIMSVLDRKLVGMKYYIYICGKWGLCFLYNLHRFSFEQVIGHQE